MKLIMKAPFKVTSCLFLLIFAIVVGRFSLIAPILGITFLLCSLAVGIVSIFKKHRQAYLESKTTRSVFARNVSIEILGILLAMVVAGLLGRYLAQITTAQIANEFTKLIAGIFIGLLAGTGIGILTTRTLGRILKT